MKSYLRKSQYGLWLAIFLFSLLGSWQNAIAQEIPNGDGDLLWERPLNGRTVNDAKFHPINGNIIAAVNHEIWEIDPKDGHTIRVFEGGYPADANDEIKTINITSDGQKIVTGGAMGKKGILIWDYNTGLVTKIITFDKIFDVYENVGIFPDNNRIIFNTYVNEYGSQTNVMQIQVYDLQLNKIIRSVNKQNTYCDKFQMSKDGNFIAFGLSYGTPGDWKNTMELWDTETLTKIKDFGNAGDIVEFRDVQISDDNQYVGFLCGGPRILYLWNVVNFQLVHKYDNASAFSFTPNTKIIIYSGTKPEDAQSNILELPELDTVYQYIWARSFFRFNENNEMYTGNKMYSNKWFNTHVDERGIKDSIKIIYSDSILRISFSQNIFVKHFVLSDTIGRIFVEDYESRIDLSEITKNVVLPAGVYVLKLTTSTGQEITQKFIVNN